jgi:hypothetical protein
MAPCFRGGCGLPEEIVRVRNGDATEREAYGGGGARARGRRAVEQV